MRLRRVQFLLDTGGYECIGILKEKHSLRGGSGIIPFEMGNRNIIPKIKVSWLSQLHSKRRIRTGDIALNFCESVTPQYSSEKTKWLPGELMAVHICKAFLQKSSPTISPHIEFVTLPGPGQARQITKKRKGFVALHTECPNIRIL